MVRLLSLLQVILLLFTGSPSVMALQFNAGLRSLGSSGGGQGSAPSLQNAGAASAALTATLAKQSLQKSQEVIQGLTTAQTEAADAAKANPANGTIGTGPSAKTVVNGLQITAPTGANEAPGLVPYYNAQNPAPSGPNIPNGPVAVPGTWSGVQSVSQAATGPAGATAPSSATVTITQNQQSAYLYWSHFNVGAQTTVNFNQSGNNGSPGSWIAFNKVMTPSDPSHIFGTINAPGQVYILNQGGILFHAGSKVNVQSLVAATLPINTSLAGDPLGGIPSGAGLANNSGHQFLFSALPLAQSQNGFSDNFDPSQITPSQLSPVSVQQLGSVVVDAGARIATSVSADGTGGKVALIGPAVVNNGSIDTPNGQTILASGLQVGLTPHPSGDASLRGLDVFVGQVTANVGGNSINTVSYTTTDPLGNQTVANPPVVIGTVINNGMIGSLELSLNPDGTTKMDSIGNPVPATDLAGNYLSLSPHASITVVGYDIQQNGAIFTSTSTSLNGRIDLVSSFNAVVNQPNAQGQSYYFSPNQSPGLVGTTGRVDLGPSSMTEILPDFTDTATIAGNLPIPSAIAITGNSINLAGYSSPTSPGATILAPGATINQANPASSINSTVYFNASSAVLPSGISLQAGNWLTANGISSFMEGASGDGNPSGSITVGAGLLDGSAGPIISAAGSTGGSVDSSQYIQTVQFRAAELANSPLQQTSPIRGKDVTVDFRVSGTYNGTQWVGSPLGNLLGYAALLQRGIGQLTSSGGTVSLQAGDSVSLAQGSTMDVSGGWIQYSGGNFATTKLLTATGQAVDISKATPDQVYTGIVANPGSVYVTPYYSGGAGGGLTLQAPSMVLGGALRGTVVNGPLQLPGTGSLSTATPVSSLSLQVITQRLVGGSLYTDSPYQPAVLFTGQSVPTGVIGINPGFFGSKGFGSLTVNDHDGSITLSSGTDLELGPGGVFSLSGATIDIGGSVNDPGGTMTLTANNVTDAQKIALIGAVSGPTAVNSGRGVIKLEGTASLSSAGNITIGNSEDASASVINGGSINLNAYTVQLNPGSSLNVSGGMLLSSAKAKPNYGNAGKINISAGHDSEFPTILGGNLVLGAQLSGYAAVGANSGSLGISASAIQIGGSSINPMVTVLNSDIFNQGGFDNFMLSGTGISSTDGNFANETPGMMISSGTDIHPVVRNWDYSLSGPNSITLGTITLPKYYRPAVSLSLSSTGLIDKFSKLVLIAGNTMMQSGSSIELDPRASLSGTTASVPTIQAPSLTIGGNIISVNGMMDAPGGSIVLSAAGTYPDNDPAPTSAHPTMMLGNTAWISVAGEAVALNDPLGLGRPIGGLLAGGSITLGPAGLPANIFLSSGSTLDVSGSSADFYLDQTRSVTPLASSAGSITLNGNQMLVIQGNLIGRSGSPSADGGLLTVSSSRFYNQKTLNQIKDPHDITLIVTQDVSQIPQLEVSPPVPGATTMGYISANTIMNGGFSSVTLSGNVLFNGSVNISLPGSITIANGGVLDATGGVLLQASYAALGQTFTAPLQQGAPGLLTVLGTSAMPTGGLGSLTVKASNIDVGNLLLNGMDSASLDAQGGVIRGDGTLDIAGNLELKAAQIYPLTETEFRAVAYPFDKETTGLYDAAAGNGMITVTQAGTALPLPLSAVGAVSLYASTIVQNGTIVSPFGRINLGWNGNGPMPVDPLAGPGASIPVTSNLFLDTGSVSSVSGVDPLTGVGVSAPFGILMNGTQWIDPAGNNITATGPLVELLTTGGVSFVSKGVSLSAASITQAQSSVINLNGGGDLTGFEWINGNSGTVDVSAPSSGSFAILPGYEPGVFPISPFSNPGVTGNDPGYTASSLTAGEQITLAGGGGLPAGTYTLLPSRYALLPGAFLVTPEKKAQDAAAPSLLNPDGTMVMAGHLSGNTASTIDQFSAIFGVNSLFLIASPSVLKSEADYQITTASSFLPSIQAASPVIDAGGLSVNSLAAMNLSGTVLGSAFSGGRGAVISLASTLPFVIGGTSAPSDSSSIDLSAAVLSSWNAGSLLIGGSEQVTTTGISVTPSSAHVTINNSGTLPNDSAAVLSAQDLILVSSGGVTLSDGSTLEASGSAPASSLTVSGDGALVRVSSDSSATVSRNGSDGAPVSGYWIGNATLSGGSVTLDSSSTGSISQQTSFDAKTINLNAGLIAVEFPDAVARTESGALNINGSLLTSLSSAQNLNFSSLSSIDFHGDGTFGSSKLQNLSLHAGAVLGDNSGALVIQAASMLIDNANAVTVSASFGDPALGGSLDLVGGSAGVLTLGAGNVIIGGFQKVTSTFSGGVCGSGSGSIKFGGDLVMKTPLLAGKNSSSTTISSVGALTLSDLQTAPQISAGSGVTIVLASGLSATIAAPISDSGGSVSIEASSGDITLSSTINAGGVEKSFFGGLQQFANAGSISLLANQGNLVLNAGTLINLSAQSGGGNAGTLSLGAPSVQGKLQLDSSASIQAMGGSGGEGGVFMADLGSYAATGGVSYLQGLETLLGNGGFTQSQNIRIRSGDVILSSGVASVTHSFTLSADQGSINLGGKIDASGTTGGSISIFAGNNLTIANGASLSVRGQNLNDAGQGGSIDLEAGLATTGSDVTTTAISGIASAPGAVSYHNSGVLDLQSGAQIDLGVGTSDAASGVLTLAAPQAFAGNGVQITEVASTIIGSSVIHVVGNYALDANTSTPLLNNGALYDYQNKNVYGLPLIDQLAVKGLAEASSFASAMASSPLPWLSGAYQSLIQINPGVQLMNSKGSLELMNNLDLSSARYGGLLNIVDGSGNPTGATIGSAAGSLTIRAAGDLILNGTISDGFTSPSYTAGLLPVGINGVGKLVSQSSWSYRITAGADFAGVDPVAVLSVALLNQNGGVGSVKLGLVTADANIDFLNQDPNNNLTTDTLNGNYQVIRTGTGNITVSAGLDIQLLNQFATIYTAGAMLPDQTLGGSFDLPGRDQASYSFQRSQSSQDAALTGAYQLSNISPVQFSAGGGNVTLRAGRDITDLQASEDLNSPQPLVNSDGTLTMVADSSRQLPMNWISRRGSLNSDGTWATLTDGEVASTAWWIDFANFFEGVGALGGGNVTMVAGRDISNVDASIPTQARMTGLALSRQVLAAASAVLSETPGGDLTVSAGRNLDAGVYYVESGVGNVTVGGSIISNPTRDVNGVYLNDLANFQNPGTTTTSPELWLPTSFFLGGNSSMTVNAGGSALIGPIGNVFLQAPGSQNFIQDKTYFSTYGSSVSFNAISVGGDITLRTTLTANSGTEPGIQSWITASSFYDSIGASYPATFQPWTRSAEMNPNDQNLSLISELLPGNMTITSMSGNITLAGDETLNPSPTGNLQLFAEGQVNGLYMQQSGLAWAYATVNVSDAIPSTQAGSLIPSVANPFSQYMLNFINPGVGAVQSSFSTLTGELLQTTSALTESASYSGDQSLVENKIPRHDPALHVDDNAPLRIEAFSGDITGISLFSPKNSQILSGGSITDIEFALQNNNPSDVTVISAAGNILPFDTATPQTAIAKVDLGSYGLPTALAGDIQLGGPGTLEVTTGGSINLGSGNQNGDGTGAGITSIGNARNPFLPFAGADLVVSAGVSMPVGMGSSVSAFSKLISTASTLPDASNYYTELLSLANQGGNDALYGQVLTSGSLQGLLSSPLTDDQKARIALNLFYLVLRDSGRDHGNPTSSEYGTYDSGQAAVKALFSTPASGDIVLNSRSIRTANGGSIDLLAPGGSVTLATYAEGTSLAPPGIVTAHGGSIGIYTENNVNLGIGRIFTLRGGDIMIWSESGNIAAGASAKTVASAPPTRVLIDPGSASVETDLSGLATGGGIGTLQTVQGVPVANVDLVAVTGLIDAGDAGIRSSGNLHLAATKILNADNIKVAGLSVGVPPAASSSAPAAAAPAAPAAASAPSSAASTAAAAASNSADKTADKGNSAQQDETPSEYTITIDGYGGSADDEDSKKAANAAVAPIQASL